MGKGKCFMYAKLQAACFCSSLSLVTFVFLFLGISFYVSLLFSFLCFFFIREMSMGQPFKSEPPESR